MFGVVNGLYYCNLERTHELDNRMYDRNIPSAQLQTVVDMRPVSTKYDLMSVVDRRVIPTVPLVSQPSFNINNTFNPGNLKSPWSGYAVHVNDESRLRNQFFANQNNAHAHYIPSSDSDMYRVKVDGGIKDIQTHKQLFKTETFAPFDPSICNIGNNIFNNYTRQQLKDL